MHYLAKAPGIEPGFAGLEAAVLPLHYTHMEVTIGFEPTYYGFAIHCLAIRATRPILFSAALLVDSNHGCPSANEDHLTNGIEPSTSHYS